MDSERLAELRRQRELIARHLAWLDGEIDRLRANPAGARGTAVPAAVNPAIADALTHEVTREVQATEAYSPDPASSARDARRGCLWLAALVVMGGLLALAAIYFTRYRDRPLLVPSRTTPAAAPLPTPHR